MSVGNITGLPFQNEYLNAQKKTEQKKQTNAFSNKSELNLKLQEITQTYQQKGSIFLTEDLKTNIVEDGYRGKLVDQKWAQSNFEYEQGNVQRMKSSSQSLENAVLQTAANIKDYASKISKTNTEVGELNQKITANTKELDSISKIFAEEQKTRDAAEYARANYHQSANKDRALNNELKSLNEDKTKLKETVGSLQQKKANNGNAIFSLTSRKSNVSSKKASLHASKKSIASDIESYKDKLSSLKANRGSAKANKGSADTQVKHGKGAVEAAPNTTVAIDTNQTIQENNGTAATLAEVQNTNTVAVNEAVQPEQAIVNEAENQDITDAQIDQEIQEIESVLSAKIREQAQIDSDIKDQEDEEEKIDRDIEKIQNEEIDLDREISEKEGQTPDIDKKIETKKQELDENQKVTVEKEEIYKKASEAHSADAEKAKSLESKFRTLNAETEAMKDKRDKNDKGLVQFKKTQDYLNALLEGQGDAKAGARAEVEIAEQKEAKQYDDLLKKNDIVEKSRLSFFSQKDIASKAKGDLKAVSLEMEAYNNIFATK